MLTGSNAMGLGTSEADLLKEAQPASSEVPLPNSLGEVLRHEGVKEQNFRSTDKNQLKTSERERPQYDNIHQDFRKQTDKINATQSIKGSILEPAFYCRDCCPSLVDPNPRSWG